MGKLRHRQVKLPKFTQPVGKKARLKVRNLVLEYNQLNLNALARVGRLVL